MKTMLFGVFLAGLITVGFFFGRHYLPFLTSDNGKISITSNPKTTVFINGEKEIETPFSKIIKPGTYEIRLLPDDESTTTSWQQQIAINPGVETYVSVNLGATEASSSWQTIVMEKIKRGKSELSIFSNA